MKLMLIGIKHSGKTSVGSELARRWALPFFDGDDMLLRYLQQLDSSVLTLSGYFLDVGEELFYRQQGEVFKRFFYDAPQEYVLAAGGGICESRTLEIPADVTPLLLDEQPKVIWKRINQIDLPAYLQGEDEPEAAFYRIMEQRIPRLRRMAKSVYQPQGRAINEVCHELERILADAR